MRICKLLIIGSLLMTNSLIISAQSFFKVYSTNGKVALYNDKGKAITNNSYDKILKAGYTEFVIIKNGYKGVVSSNGKIKVPAKYTELRQNFCEDQQLYPAKDSLGWIIYNHKGRKLTRKRFENASVPNSRNELIVQKKGEYYLMNHKGRIIKKNLSEDEIKQFDFNGECAELDISSIDGENYTNFFMRNGKYGCKENGSIIIPAIYDRLYQAESNFFIGRKDGKYQIISSKGEVLTNSGFDHVSHLNKYVIVKKNEKFGVFSVKTAQLIIPINYSKILFVE